MQTRHSQSIDDLAIILFAWSVFLAMTCSRIDYYIPGLGHSLTETLMGIAVLQSFYLLILSPRSAVLLGVLLSSILLHSLANLYQPSLRSDVPWLDYFLAPGVSANYCFDMAKRYLYCIFVFAPGAFVCGLVWARASSLARKSAYLLVATAMGANFLVIAFQGLVRLSFMARGSGTALEALRATALLEDSGASTVVVSCFCAIFLGLAMFSIDANRRKQMSFLFIISLLIGRYTGGRTFFISTATAAILMLSILGFRSFWVAKLVAILSGMLGIYFFGPAKMREFFDSVGSITAPSFTEWLVALAQQIDKARFLHFQVLWMDFVDHIFFGSSLGSFHANNAFYTAKVPGADLLVDNPAVLYLAIAAAFGLAGILMLVLWLRELVVLARGLRNCSFEAKESADLPLLAAGLAVALSLLMSFFFGVHFIFISAGGVFAIAMAAMVAAHRRASHLNNIAMALVVAISCLLLGRAAFMAASPVEVAAFRWKETGHPQIPLSLNIPISSRGRTGVWLPNNYDLATDGRPTKIFVEFPPQFYPLDVRIVLESHTGQKLWEDTRHIASYQLPDPGQEFSVELPLALASKCSREFNPEEYCRLKIATNPSWTYLGCKVGFFLVY